MDFTENKCCQERRPSVPKFLLQRVARCCGLVGVLGSLSACSVDPASQAMLDTYRLAKPESASHVLQPNLRYLRVQTDGRELFMALGHVDQTPDGTVEVWYSSDADVLHLRDGRVVGATLKNGPDWSAVSFLNLPSWDAVGDRAEFLRLRDESPGYRYGIREKMSIRRIATPGDTQLKIVPASSLTWFVEEGASALPAARYGVDLQGTPGHQVVYAEQCLSKALCFSWQSWPPASKGTP